MLFASKRLALLAVGVLLLGLSLLMGSGRQPKAAVAAPQVYVFPPPGGVAALPKTQLSFRGAIPNPGQIRVTGSRTGVHTGTVVPHSDQQGASFIPQKPFASQEVVTVQTFLNIAGGTNGTYQFTTVQPGTRNPIASRITAGRVKGDIERFRSRPDLAPAAITIDKNSRHTGPGDIFLDPEAGPLQDGPMIRDWRGRLVWFRRVPKNQNVCDFRTQRLYGKPVLTWWQGYVSHGVGRGEGVILDNHYRTKAVVRAGNGMTADLHEFLLTRHNTALITAYYPKWDPRPRGPGRVILDSTVQEIDIPTGLVMFEWDALDHVPVQDTYQPLPRNTRHPFDYFHANAVQELSDGDLLISSRNTRAAYAVSRQTTGVFWKLGGKHPTFQMGHGTHFAYQHDVRMHSATRLSMFDDGAGPPQVEKQSHVLGLRIDWRRRRVSRAFSWDHTPSILSNFEGNAQKLPHGHYFVGWGQDPHFTEFNAGGRIIFDAHYIAGVWQYRAYRMRWSGTPTTRPSVAAQRAGRTTTLYASWNGATNLSYWRVLAGSNPNRLRKAGTVRSGGFETSISTPAAAYVAVVALDSRRHAISRPSRAVRG
jgi:hypothetical protein